MPGVIHRLTLILLGRSPGRMSAWHSSGPRYYSLAAALVILSFSTGEMPVPRQIEVRQTMERGSRVYRQACAMCHGETGAGRLPFGPALAGSSWLLGCPPEHLPAIILDGVCGPIPGSSAPYPVMPALRTWLQDQQVADVSTYVFRRWAHRSDSLLPKVSALLRQRTPARAVPWRIEELNKSLPRRTLQPAFQPF
jgi:mono/diheme cytochrome c family protein